MLRAVDYSHSLLREHLFRGDVAIDATAGNGHDTHFLAQLTGPEGMVYAFDVQTAAIESTRKLLERWGVPPDSVQLVHGGHETMEAVIAPSHHGQVGAVIFNLGYLPGSDKTVVTVPATTLAAMDAALRLLRPGGLVIAVLYTGHPGGPEEAEAVRAFAAALPADSHHAVEYRTLNTKAAAPSVLVMEKLGIPEGHPEPEYEI
jgi:predicted O-methyltransferase YrrM